MSVWFFAAGVASAFVSSALVASFHAWTGSRNTLVVLASAALAAVVWAGWLIRGNWGRVRRELLGAKGERAVGDVLDALRRELGYFVLHDVPIHRDGKVVANVDHILIGPVGVIVIETKTLMKPPAPSKGGRKAVIAFDGKRVVADGLPLERDPVAQVRRNAEDVRAQIRRGNGDAEVPAVVVWPVLLFPGWWVEETKGTDFGLLNPDRLFAWIRGRERNHGADLLSEERAAQLCESLRTLTAEGRVW